MNFGGFSRDYRLFFGAFWFFMKFRGNFGVSRAFLSDSVRFLVDFLGFWVSLGDIGRFWLILGDFFVVF